MRMPIVTTLALAACAALAAQTVENLVDEWTPVAAEWTAMAPGLLPVMAPDAAGQRTIGLSPRAESVATSVASAPSSEAELGSIRLVQRSGGVAIVAAAPPEGAGGALEVALLSGNEETGLTPAAVPDTREELARQLLADAESAEPRLLPASVTDGDDSGAANATPRPPY